MERNQWVCWLLAISALLTSSGVQGIRFVIDKKECWYHEVTYDGDEVLVSYVVIKSESMWSFDDNPKGVDLVVEAPAGHQVHVSKGKVEDKFTFVAVRKGVYKFCFFNWNTIHETVDFDVHVGYHIYDPFAEHVKDGAVDEYIAGQKYEPVGHALTLAHLIVRACNEGINFGSQICFLEHIEPLMMQIERLEESMYSIQFEQHWLLAQTDRQLVVSKTMSRRIIYKAVLEAVALIGCSVLQVYLLQRLFERKLNQSRV